MTTPRRRTQAERSHETQQKILDVTLDCLLRKGLRDTSTVDVARVAGVSRGAFLHHYPSKEILLKEALRHLLTREIDDVRALARDIGEGRVGLDGFLDAMWARFSGPLYMITLEFVTAARTDPAIKDALREVALEYNDSLDEIWETLLPDNDVGHKERRLAFNATLCLLRGMGTQSVWRDDPQLFNNMLAYWKDMIATTVLAPPVRQSA